MRCSICGKEGHNARTCPYRDQNVPRDRAFWLKIDNLTEREESDLLAQIIKDKNRIAPKGRAAAAKGNVKDLPGRIHDALGLLGEGSDSGSEEE